MIINRKKYKYRYLFFHVLLFISFLVAIRIFGTGADYFAYKKIFSSSDRFIEPFFYLLKNVNLYFFHGDVFYIYFFSCFIALLLKYKFFLNYARNLSLTLLFYFSTFFFLHEYTQIRAAIAIGIFFVSIEDIIYHRPKHFLFKTILACMFHFSSIIMIIIYLYCNCLKKKKKFYIMLPWTLFAIDIILLMLNIKIDFRELLDIIFAVNMRKNNMLIDYMYRHLGHFDSGLTIFNKVYISLLCILSFIYYCYNGFIDREYFNEFCIFKILTFSAVSFYFLINFPFPVVVSRVSEYTFPLISVLLPNTITRIKEKYLFILFIFIYSILIFFLFARVVFVVN